MATLRFSGILLRFVDYERTITSHASHLGDALAEVEDRFPRLRPILRDSAGNLRTTHRVLFNGEVTAGATLTTPLAEDDDVEFLAAVAGGA
ncbi:MoaD/ThiS family protein (plasmid) [Streptomyces sp. NBC_00868]|uniref:MoaD/ThiS family protein n=1 Tax=Streptomyces sp. NBC_00868 TaxID=2903683 RepID=UPI002F90D9D4|nr:MoaD/ThiS family protein [Streptomyces sp. NBC_00868]